MDSRKGKDGREMIEPKSLSVKRLPEGGLGSSDVLPLKDAKCNEYILFREVQGAMRYIPDFPETCKAILDAVMSAMEAENCSLMLQDPYSGKLSVLAARGKNEKRSTYYSDSSCRRASFKPGEGIAGWVLKEGQAVLVGDVKDDPRFVEVKKGLDSKVRSLICFPIRDKDQIVGVFNLSHSRQGAFDEGNKLVLSYISAQMSAALTSAGFFLKIREMNRLLKDSGEIPAKAVIPTSTSAPPSAFLEIGKMVVARDQGTFLFASEKMQRVKEKIDQVANTDVTIFIQGESGVGKEVVARSIHMNSVRRDKPFVKVNCAALPPELLESELFGYEKGAFTGAYRQKPGKFELANGGTIFLDEIADISPSLQAKLLQVLQDREFSRLGGKSDIRVDVRVLVSTNKNIEEAVNGGQFRDDLYYRLNVVNITIPPLRDRKEEIPIFVEYFLNKFGAKYQKKVRPVSEPFMKALLTHHWSGNIRELQNVIQRYVVLANEEEIIGELGISRQNGDFFFGPKEENLFPQGQPSLKQIHREAARRAEARVISKALEITNYNRKKAAQLLNISYKSLLYNIKKCGIQRRINSQDS